MNQGFVQIAGQHAGIGGDNSFWPSFTDVMMVITLIFLMATSLLVVRNWQLVAELQESIAAEQIAAELIESTSQENATLEERLANAEQANSILRLRMLKKDEELQQAQTSIRQQQSSIATLETRNQELARSLEHTEAQLASANLEIDAAMAQNQELALRLTNLERQMASLNQQLAEQKIEGQQTSQELAAARLEIAELSASGVNQQLSIDRLTQEKSLLTREIDTYNQQLLTLKGEYDTVKSKYEELIKPARSAKGKYIAQVYYIKGEAGEVIRYRQPGDSDFSRLSLAEVEARLDKLKQEQGKNLYVKIIIPQNSGLTYNEAWNFMRSLLVKYDYYYQE